jgi:UDP-glucose 4-epimerase
MWGIGHNPDKYYRNNVVGTLTLLEAMLAASVKQFVFFDLRHLRGAPNSANSEDHPQNPINPMEPLS